MKKNTPSRPQYEQFEGNEYTKRLEEDLPKYSDWVRSNWEDYVKPISYQDYVDYANDIYKTQWGDMLNQYQENANRLASQNYNRFGGLRSTPSMITEDKLNRQMNDLATRLSSSSLADAFNMANTEQANRLNSLNQVYGMQNQAGNYVTQNKDIPNLNIRNNNLQNAWLDQVDKANAGGWDFGNMASGALSGAVQGGASGGWIGALAGGIGGGVLGGLSGYSNSSGQQASQLGGSFGKVGGGIGNFLNTKQGGILYGKSNPWR